MTHKAPPTVSVIIPTYNRAHLVGRAIRSVMSQTCQDFEIIVVDDGSTDDTEKVVSSFNDPRIRYYQHQTNRGHSATRNTGITMSRGKYIAFLDSDDEYLPEKLEAQLEVFEHQASRGIDVGIVVTGALGYDDDVGKVVHYNLPMDFRHPYEELLMRKHTCYNTMLVRRECFDHVGLWDERLAVCENWDMAVRVGTKYGYGVVPKPLLIAYEHSGQHVSTTTNSRGEALRLIASKYSAEMKQYPKFGAKLRLNIANDDFQKGLMAEARRQSIAAIRLRPFWYKGYIYFLRALLGTRLYRKIVHA